MHSLETGIVLAVAAFFFFSFLTFTFVREGNISNELINKFKKERQGYELNGKKIYNPELSFSILNIILEGKSDGSNEGSSEE